MEAPYRFSGVSSEKPSGENGWKPVRNRRGASPRKERSERYSRNGPLSPLRSPLRAEDKNTAKTSRRFSEGRRRYKDSRDSLREAVQDPNLEPINTITKQIEELEACSAPAWAILNKDKMKPDHVDEQEFPSLDTKYTPEPHKSLDDSTSSTLSWASQVEEQECNSSRSNGSKRKLVMNDAKRSNSRGSRRTNFNRRPGKSSRGDAPSEELEEDDQVIHRRQKQLEYGKGTDGYKRYSLDVTRHERTKNHPWTPDKSKKFSRRSWDMQVKIWRRQLHIWDAPTPGQDDTSSIASSDLEMSNTAMEIESNADSCEVRVSTPQNSQASENDLIEPVSPVVQGRGHKHPVIDVPQEDEEFLDL